MSGPKVVRIVTREEVLEICLGLLAQVEAALVEWEKVGSKNKVIDDQDRARQTSEVKHLRQLIEQNRFSEAQKRAPELLRTLRFDMSQRLEALYSAAATARRRENSLRYAARQLQRQLEAGGVVIPDDLRDSLARAASDSRLGAEDLQKVVTDALRALPDQISDTKADQKEIIQQLQNGEKPSTLDDWLRGSQTTTVSPAIETLDRYLAQLAAYDEPEQLEALTERAANAASETDDRRRKMQFESLCVEAASMVRLAQRRLEFRQVIADERAAAASAGDVKMCFETFQELDRQLIRDDFSGVQISLERIKQLRSETSRMRAAQASRAALLGGLKELGYQVKEGMSVAWTKNKRLVVRHPTMSGVALEFGGVNEQCQFQARVVAVQGEYRDPTADKQAETTWCHELSKVQARLETLGGDLKIDRALPAGNQPLKTVILEQAEDDEVLRPQVRHLE